MCFEVQLFCSIDFIKPICMPYGELTTKDFSGKLMEVAGWGFDETGMYSVS